jgi:hypothetical protein
MKEREVQKMYYYCNTQHLPVLPLILTSIFVESFSFFILKKSNIGQSREELFYCVEEQANIELF